MIFNKMRINKFLWMVVLVLLSSGSVYGACNPPSDIGNWEIDGTETCEDIDIYVDGYVYIRSGDTLILHNVTLYLNLTANNQHYILVQSGGNLTADQGTYFNEEDNSHYYNLYNDGYANFNHATLDNSRVRLQTRYSGRADISNGSDIYYLYTYYNNPVVVAEDSIIRYLYVYVYNGDDVVIDNLNDHTTPLSYNISSSTTNLAINLTNITITAGSFFRINNDGGTLNVTNSDIYFLYHTNDANDHTYVTDTVLTYFLYYNYNGQYVEINDLWGPYTKDSASNFTRIINTTNNNLVFTNVGLPANGFYYIYTRYANSRTKVNNCRMKYVYTHDYGNTTITNSQVDNYVYAYGFNTGINSYTTLDNVTILQRLYSYGNSINNFTDVNVSQYAWFYQNSQSTLTNCNLKTSYYTRIYDNAIVNFTQPSSRIENLELIGTAETPTIYGYVEFVEPIVDWAAGNTLNRYFPFNVTGRNGGAVENGNVTIKNGTEIVNSGLTGSDGIVYLNITGDHSSDWFYNYSIFLEEEFQLNITMLDSTAPSGILLTTPIQTLRFNYSLSTGDTLYLNYSLSTGDTLYLNYSVGDFL